MAKPTMKNRFSPSEHTKYETGEGQAQQHLKSQCDLNNIMAKFNKTGMINHISTQSPGFTVVPNTTLHEAMNITAQANSMFENLPSKIRNRFSNDPVLLNEFLNDESNESEARELGLLNPLPEPSEAPTATQPVQPGGTITEDPNVPPESP